MSRSFDEYLATPEMQLLLACCRRAAGGIDDPELSRALAKPFDESVFSELCKQHRLTLLIYKIFVLPNRDRFSGETAARFEKESVQLTLRHLQLSKCTVDVHREFDSGGIRHVFLKGAVLNQQLSGDELMRSSIDVDVLIDRKKVLQADECLRRLGFTPEIFWWQAWFRIPFHKTHRKDVVYRKAGHRFAIELHWKTDWVEILLDPGKFDWKNDVQYCEFHGESVPVLSDACNCLYLCLHAAKHHWSKFRWLLDIPLFMRKQKLSSDTLLELAGRHGLENVVLEAFSLSERLLGINLESGGGTRTALLKRSGNHAAQRFTANQYGSPVLRRLSRTYLGGLIYPTVGIRLNFWFVQSLEWIFQIPNKAFPGLKKISRP